VVKKPTHLIRETTLNRVLACTLVLFAGAAAADADPKFVKLRDSAESVGGLSQFLDKYVGECPPAALGGAECLQNAGAFRKQATGKRFYMIINEETASQISMGPYDPSSGDFTLNVVPFFPASNSAVTQGAPSKLDANGNPVMPFIYVKGTVPEGGNAQTVSRWVSMRALRIQLVFTPMGLWELKKKDGSKITGVKARIDAMLISVGRSGEQVGLYMGR
jgi:hypothetical protein